MANSKFDDFVTDQAMEIAGQAKSDFSETGISLKPLERVFHEDGSITCSSIEVELKRDEGIAYITIKGPQEDVPASSKELHDRGAEYWGLKLARELDDAILHLRINELEIGVLVFRSSGDQQSVLAHEAFLMENYDSDWMSR